MRTSRVLATVLAAAAAATAITACRPGGAFASGSGKAQQQDQPVSAAGIEPDLVVVDSLLGYQQAEAAGTGIVLTSDGEVLTNNHVIAGATSIRVTDIGNGKQYNAKVVGFDRSADVAVIKLSGAHGLRTAPLGSGTPSVGASVVAVGNAGGTGSLTSAPGTVAALNQSITATDESSGSSEQLTGLIQVAADVQAGDSGGPLVDASGKVIGVDTAANAGFRFRSSSQAGFAIPIDAAMAVAKQIEAGHGSGTVHIGETAVLGVTVTSSPDQSGAQIVTVVSGSAAENAGLQEGDVITSVDGTNVDSATTLTNLMDGHHPGQTLSVGWSDQFGSPHTTDITVRSGPAG